MNESIIPFRSGISKFSRGTTSRIRFRPVTNAQDTANNILVDFDAESQSNLLGNSRAAPTGITPFHFNDRVDEFFTRSFRTRLSPTLGRKQHLILSFRQQVVEMQQSGRLQNDSGPPERVLG